eukprot:CAMPEP_0169119940 /NCGR_PEP_ID=MMETSP1015-20121227/31833_1 /TAXON_ID=342587 /ORGANISM="Karlodinium micrum, Strain CCMP2283" /LENGTH=79 /DNA_ID=CAMNT_0009182871 /DNA_START=232 /DNA_END=471 /DNA_ORIENTATION=-
MMPIPSQTMMVAQVIRKESQRSRFKPAKYNMWKPAANTHKRTVAQHPWTPTGSAFIVDIKNMHVKQLIPRSTNACTINQ